MTDRDLARTLLTDMIRIRRMEEKCAEMYSAGKIRGFLHLYIGEEAVAAGSLRVLGEQDAVIATYREHAHALLRGIPMTKIMAEMFGKQEGCSGGRGGSMHLFDAGRRFYGGNAIVAAGLPLAAGLAFADKQLNRNRISACYFGEGATAEGAFHEAMNMAAVVATAGAVLLREQPVRDGHRHRPGAVPGGPGGQGAVLPRAGRVRRRDGCHRLP